VFASGEPDNADRIWSAVNDQIDDLVRSLNETDLERLRNTLATQVTLAGERSSGRMQRIGRLWLYLNQHASLEEELDRINSVTLDDLCRVHRDYPFSPRTVGKMLPAE
jgi:predicted Zn-dependent peptidase